jgi:hypothetical protein
MRYACNGRLQPTTLPQSPNQTHTFTVNGFSRFIVTLQACKLLPRPLLQIAFKRAVLFIKKWPGQMCN